MMMDKTSRSRIFTLVTLVALLPMTTSCERVESAPPPASNPAPQARHEASRKSTSKPTPAAARPIPPGRSKVDTLRPLDETFSGDMSLSGARRARHALAARSKVVRALFAQARIPFPPRQLLFRVFKKEKHLEVWAQGRPHDHFRRVATYTICATSGEAGPKLREGDGQVPEGFYTIDLYNPHSAYYLAMRISYPNRRDRKLRHTGSAIMIHGNCVSIGCLAMTDGRIEELWVMADAVRRKRRVRVHIYPQRDLAAAIAKAKDRKTAAFWTNIKIGHDYFDAHGKPPKIGVDRHGRYTFK